MIGSILHLVSQVVLEIVRNTQQQRLKDVPHEIEEVSILI